MSGSISTNPMFIEGRKFLSEKKFEESIAMFSALLQSLVSQHGEMALETGRAYFEYGNALLTKVEDTPTDGLLGAAADNEKATESIKKILMGQQEEINEENIEDDEEEVEDGEDEVQEDEKGENLSQENVEENENVEEDENAENDKMDGEENNEENEGEVNDDENEVKDEVNDEEENKEVEEANKEEEEVEDLQIAWELLEVSRKIFEENPGADTDSFLVELYIRLGDLQRINNLYDEAVAEYNKSLNLCDVICKPYERQFSDIYYSLALTHIYKSGMENANKSEEKSKALEYYVKAKNTIALRIEELKNGNISIINSSSFYNSNSSSSNSISNEKVEKELLETKDLIDELTETIDALQSEIKELNSSSNSSNSSSSSLTPSAPIPNFFGSGNSTSSGFQFPSFSFSNSSTSNVGGEKSENEIKPNTLLVKRKSKTNSLPVDSSSTANKNILIKNNENTTTIGDSENEINKKVKVSSDVA